MFDLIRVVDLEVQALIGVTAAERRRPQKLLISLELTVESTAKAAATDDIGLTVNYFDVTKRVKALCSRKNSYRLLETLAEKIAARVLKEFDITFIKVEIKKFILPDARWVAVVIKREKS